MSESAITDEEAADLCAKLEALDLSEPQRALLDAILKIAYDATTSDDSLKRGFDGSFEPGQAALIMSYHGATSVSMITRSFPSSAAMITRMAPGMITRGPLDP